MKPAATIAAFKFSVSARSAGGTEEERAHSTIRSYLAVTSMCSHSGPHGHQRKTPPQVGPGAGLSTGGSPWRATSWTPNRASTPE
jgi:hypothetical protein